jgi:hypothetical protein
MKMPQPGCPAFSKTFHIETIAKRVIAKTKRIPSIPPKSSIRNLLLVYAKIIYKMIK